MFSAKGIHGGCFPLILTGKNWVLTTGGVEMVYEA